MRNETLMALSSSLSLTLIVRISTKEASIRFSIDVLYFFPALNWGN